MHPLTRSGRFAAFACVTFEPLLAAGCLSPENEARVGRHFDLDPWGGAMVQTVEEPSQWAPVVALVAE